PATPREVGECFLVRPEVEFALVVLLQEVHVAQHAELALEVQLVGNFLLVPPRGAAAEVRGHRGGSAKAAKQVETLLGDAVNLDEPGSGRGVARRNAWNSVKVVEPARRAALGEVIKV